MNKLEPSQPASSASQPTHSASQEGYDAVANLPVWRMAWDLLDRRERRNALIVLAMTIIAGFAAAAMVASVLPFLTVLAQPERIGEIAALDWFYTRFGFTSTYAFLVALGAASFGVIVVSNLIQIARIFIVSRFTNMRVHSISQKLLAAYLRQPYEFFLDRHSGEMSTQILAESQLVVDRFFIPAAQVFASGFTVLSVVILLVWVDPIVAILCFVVFGGTYGLIFSQTRARLAMMGKVRAEANKARYKLAGEALGGIKDIKLLGREAAYLDRYAGPSRRMAKMRVTATLLGTVPQFGMQMIAFGGVILLCLVLLSPESLEGGDALGAIVPILGVFAFAGQRLMPELSKLYGSITELRFAGSALASIHADFALRNASAKPTRIPPAPLGLKRTLELDDVSYRYPRDSNAGLTDVSLKIRAGERIGIVGPTGAGKTTLVDIVLGLLRPASGVLRIDGADLTETNLRAWQQSLAYVPQDIFLLDASVAENIALGVAAHEIDEVRVARAARIAQLDEFIRNDLSHGYQTMVGERGVRLSGGQRQRIGIARALYRDADVIIFDEATSALDNLTEREVMSSIEALPGDKTVMIIAHRLSTVRRSDRIIMLERGKVLGMGSWDELHSTSEAFRALARVD
ncbi:ABC transporter ATP-binding protein [Erythrobacter sp. HL-111]|uniref:ABC transporter ATP-binding protein n=1 Tax=Erythrobacter sp. HL-111 TaxID=1798193 RepID=UPI0006D9D9DE|nr:ABC transporter ATP-binding protein [Erythrobacter sp. HL-111]KPP95366.1 MAG: ABC-type bacteriocin/lantibiotic exporter [Erythrobacteraceae bacterium HL-111]SDS66939.1 ABC-type bacteriocin/lantibiotic exporter, contains an N-terminal double-glycine peptidase domain [Erythrobacter sp. HL-111]